LNESLFKDALDAVAAGASRITVTGLWGSSRGLFVWALGRAGGAPTLVVCPTEKEADALFRDISYFEQRLGDGSSPPVRFPAYDILPYDIMEPDPQVVAGRIRALKAVSEGSARLAVTSVKAVAGRLPEPAAVVGGVSSAYLLKGFEFDRDGLLARLDGTGYTRTAAVYEPGEYSVRGGILDVFPPDRDRPVRTEFFGDTIESIREFDTETQRSTAELEEVTIPPAKDSSADADSLLTDYFKERPVIVLDGPDRVWSEAAAYDGRVFSAYEESERHDKRRPEELYISVDGLRALVESGRSVEVGTLPVETGPGGPKAFEYHTRSIEGLRLKDIAQEPWPEDIPKTPVAVLCLNLKGLARTHSVNVVLPSRGQADRLRDIFAAGGVAAVETAPAVGPPESPEDAAVRITVGELSAGFLMDDPAAMFITAAEVFGERPKQSYAPRARAERFLTSLSELTAGSYVVHSDHGIGKYIGIKRLKLMGVETDFLEMVYAGSDRLYVPMEELDKVQKYIGTDGARIALEKLGGAGWERTKARAKKAVEEMAGELLQLYAARAVAPGFPYPPDDVMYTEMESSFEYEETPDQARAIEDVKADLERPHPMDRLVCGDVGYGKTEVAVRAAFKVASGGKQTAILVPTTLLADQHYKTFSARLAAFPVRVEMLSRFTDKKYAKEVVKGLADGTVDIVIGTHRLLQKDVAFHDLGLLVIDEEHRFGVKHKEALKKMRKQVDILTLTATPIPRTLNMSISGIRDLSVIETPPPDRQPIKTVISRFDRSLIREAILRELSRGGQVFFVHNRIESIFSVGDLLRRLVPEAKIGVAHGRMHEDALEDVMTRFISNEYDLLLSTSIIESGLDIPSANTIIIDRADRFGLADLYQLRGRVGRSRARGYAYLLVPGEDALTETARKRLQVLSELTELGAGFRLALHDLEIRGAGDLLGAEQSGHIAAVGFEMYTRMLEDAVKNLRGEEAEETTDPALDLKVSAFLPDEYIPELSDRLNIYKRLAGAADEQSVSELCGELADRYGPMPPDAVRLAQVMEVKVIARRMKIAGIHLTPTEVKVTFSEKVDISTDRLVSFIRKQRGQARFVPQYSLFVKKPSGGWDALYSLIKNCLKALS